MIRNLLLLSLILFAQAFPLDHFYAARAAVGASTLLGSAVPTGTEPGFAFSAGVLGAQAFYPSGPLWGTELSYSSSAVARDTLLWSDATGDYTNKVKFTQRYGHLSLGLFVMKSWDFGLGIYAGPQISYLSNCSNSIGSSSTNCQDAFQMFQVEAQGTFMYSFNEQFAADIRYVQTALPMDKNGTVKMFPGVLTLGFLYQF